MTTVPPRRKEPSLPGGESREGDSAFDELVDLALRTAQASLAAVSLVEDQRRWFFSSGGLSADEERSAMALCRETIRDRLSLVVTDLERDERFRNDPLFRSGIRFYAGFPLVSADAGPRGVLSVLDRAPRGLDETQREALEALARRGADLLLDITDRKRAEARIAKEVYKDPLTNLSNSAHFMERLRQRLAEARRQDRRLAVVYLDLDRFKFINDTWGHSVGDLFLQSLALRLTERVREVDTVARVGGDEFVILMPDIRQTEDLSTIAQKLLATVAHPVDVKGRTLEVTASIGIASYPEDGEDPEIILRNAGTAMYRAKELGPNGFQMCTAEMTSRAVARISLESALRKAVNREELVVHYQPIVSLMTGRITRLEALVRWDSTEKGIILPADFIPIAEESGLILPVGDYVLRTACRKLKEWQVKWLPGLIVAVNVSARQFRDSGLLATIDRALSESGLSPEHLEVEITESVAMESAEIVVRNLEALRGRGVRIAIDDFGTGYSSLNYLKRFPVHSLKIDRSFVTEVGTNPADAGIVRAVIEMAHGLKLSAVAEGVETREQFLHLQRFGCDEMQGYWVSRPLPAESIDEMLERELELWVKPI